MPFDRLKAYRRESPLGWRLLVSILGISMLAALLSSAAQLVFNYRQEVQQIDQRIEQLVRVNEKALSVALWNYDLSQLESQLHGLVLLSEIKYAEIRDANGKVFASAGMPPAASAGKPHVAALYFDSIQAGGPQRTLLGTVTVIPGFEGIYERVLDYALLIVGAEIAKSFIVSIFILFIVTQCVSRPLTLLSRQIRRRSIQSLDKPWQIFRPRWAGQDDELDVLVGALNGMQDTLRNEIKALDDARRDLQRSEERNRALLETTNAVPWIADCINLRFSYIGPQCEQVLGVSEENCRQANFFEDRLFGEAYSKLAEYGKSGADRLLLEFQLIRDDGTPLWVLMQGNRSKRQGEYRGYLLNVDQQKKAEFALKNYQSDLERQVEERTCRLRLQNEELNELNRRLASTQLQLLQSEKMASVGQLAAGVAHEINNPIGFVSSNVRTLGQYNSDLLDLLARYESIEECLTDALLVEINEFKNRIDYDYLKGDIGSLIAQSSDGLARVKKIVQDLRDFSRLDSQDGWTEANLHECIDSTLNIARNEIKYTAQVECHYGVLPSVECQPGQINQVLLNLLVNAAHAIKEPGLIVIRTGAEDGRVWIEIADNGSGISPDILPRIFEPFFTTKPVGKGTGLGLSISYGIVQRHHGEITCRSEPGAGTTFRIVLPVHRPPLAADSPTAAANAS